MKDLLNETSKLDSMEVVLTMLVFFNDMVNEKAPKYINIKEKYELMGIEDIPPSTKKQKLGEYGFIVDKSLELTEAMDISQDIGFNDGVKKSKIELSNLLARLVIRMKDEVSPEMWSKIINIDIDKIREGDAYARKTKQ